VSVRFRIVLAFLLVAAIGFYILFDWIVEDLTPQYRKSTEEPLVDMAETLAAVAAASARDGSVDVALFKKAFENIKHRELSAQIFDYEKTVVDLRVYLTDARGRVLFDSADRATGDDFSQWRDVKRTLEGEYGARTSRDIPGKPKESVMYIAAPIVVEGETVGVLSIGKPTATANLFINHARAKMYLGGAVAFVVVLLVSLLTARMLTRPVERLTHYARAVRDGKRETFPELGSSEIGELGEAFNQMRETLEGRNYVENYVQTLTHEIKSPLAAIRGAAELLQEGVPDEDRKRFLQNILSEGARINEIVERLLLLASLETKHKLDREVVFRFEPLVREAIGQLQSLADAKHVRIQLVVETNAEVLGDRALLLHAVSNLLQNALEFSPEGSTVQVTLSKRGAKTLLTVKDQGPGVPAYALERVFDRFYSLKRPDSGKKSSGLGLSLVQEVAELHDGTASIENLPDGGTLASLLV